MCSTHPLAPISTSLLFVFDTEWVMSTCEHPGAGAVLPGRVAALPCAGYAPWACRVRFAVSTVCSPCAGRKHRGRQPRGLGFRLAGAVPSPTGGLQLAFTAHVDARPLTTSGRLQTCPLVPVGARGSRKKPGRPVDDRRGENHGRGDLDHSRACGGELIYDPRCSFYQLHHKYTGRVVRVLISTRTTQYPNDSPDVLIVF